MCIRDREGNGAIAGALSYVVTESMMVAAGLGLLARHLLTARRVRRVALCLVAGGAQLAVGWPLRHLPVVLPAAAGLAAYGAAVVLLRVPTQAERDLARRVLGRALGRVRRLLPGR